MPSRTPEHPAGDYESVVLNGYLGNNRFGRASIVLSCETRHGVVEYSGELEGQYADKTLAALRRAGWSGPITNAVAQLTGKQFPLWIKHKVGKQGGVFLQVYASVPRADGGAKAGPMTQAEQQALAARLEGRSEPGFVTDDAGRVGPVTDEDVPF